jgi:diphosphomevalonate decarboxylase
MKAKSHPNIALIKYWGKRNEKLILPTKSSISISLEDFVTATHVTKNTSSCDLIWINGKEIAGTARKKVINFLNVFRKLYNVKDHFIVDSKNSFPTAAGLASSASGFAALTKALNELYDLKLSKKELSILARRGSGSACRSIYDGFVIWHRGKKPDGSDSYAEQLFPQNHWPELKIVPIILSGKKKKICSRTAMQQTVKISPLYHEWVARSEARIKPMIDAIKNKDFHALGELAERDALEMHKCMRSAQIDYFLPETHQIIGKVQQLRKDGIPCYVTIDAGPNVKIITLDDYAILDLVHTENQGEK